LKPTARDVSGAGSLTVRRLTLVDENLAQQLNPLFDEGMVWDQTEGERFFSDPSNLLVVAYWNGHLCGFATACRLQRFDSRRAEVNLYEIGVDEQYQRRGIASAIVAEVNRWAREVEADETWVLTEPTNTAARALYRATGGYEDEQGSIMYTYRLGTSM